VKRRRNNFGGMIVFGENYGIEKKKKKLKLGKSLILGE
jgi:hypothetical protein